MNVAPFVENKILIQSAKRAAYCLVFKTIRENAPISLEALSTFTSLSNNSLTPILLELMSHDLIEDNGTNLDFSERKFTIKGSAHLVAGIKLSDKTATVVMMDFAGNQVGEYVVTPPAPVLCPEDAVDFIKETLEDGLKQHGKQLADLSIVCLGLPGLIDAEKGIVHWSPSLSKRNLNMENMLRDKLGIDVCIDNDANLVAKAEHLYGTGKNLTNFIVVTIEQGVGLGIIVNGEIYRGTSGRGAELGHAKVQLDGALCRCGQRGCLEAYVGDYALLHEARMAIQIDASLSNENQMKKLLAIADQGQGPARNILLRSGRMFAMGLASIVNILAPEQIIISTERMEGNPIYLNAVIDELYAAVTQLGGPPPDVVLRKWDVHMWALGAASQAVERVADDAITKIVEQVA